MAEFVVNNKAHIAIKVSPFMANYRRELRMGGDIRKKGKVEKATEFMERIKKMQGEAEAVKFTNSGLGFFFIFYFHFYFIFSLFSYFSIFRTARVRVDQLCCHHSHLIAKSQDRLHDSGEFSRRFESR